MYIGMKNTEEAKNFIKELIKEEVEVDVREYATMIFLIAELKKKHLSAYISFGGKVLRVIDVHDTKRIQIELKNENLDCVFELDQLCYMTLLNVPKSAEAATGGNM